MPRARSPFNPKIAKPRQKTLARQLRTALAAAPMDMQVITEALEIQPEEVVVILRRLRGSRRGRLHSAIRFGHVCWWWDPEPIKPEKGAKSAKTAGASKKTDRRRRKAPAGQPAPDPPAAADDAPAEDELWAH